MGSLPEVSATSLAATAAIGGVLIGVSYLIKSSIRYSGAPPGPRRIPILGNLELAPEDGSRFNDALQKICKKYGPVMCMYIGNKPVIVISDYAALREAFLNKGLDFAGRPDSAFTTAYNPGHPDIKGIIDADYSNEWKRQRHTSLSILRTLGWGKSIIEKRIQEEVSVLIEELTNAKGMTINPANLLETCVANIMCSLLFGERYEHGDAEFLELLGSVDGIFTAFTDDPGGDYIPLMKLTPAYNTAKKDALEAGGRVVAFYRKKIQEAKDKLANGEETADFVTSYLKELEKIDNNDGDSQIKEDWTIQVLPQPENQFSGDHDSQIKEDWTIQIVSDFFIAGAETTTTTLRWAVLFMANYQDVQEKVFQEIISKLNKNEAIFLKDRENLPYTEATIMEVQRLSAVAPVAVPHRTMADTTLAGFTIPKNSEVWGNLYAVLRDPKEFPDPETLKPERFLNSTLDSVEKNEKWVPFGLGRRTCLGEQLARQELFIFFTNIIRSFKILPPSGEKCIKYREIFKFVLKPSEHKVRFIKREK